MTFSTGHLKCISYLEDWGLLDVLADDPLSDPLDGDSPPVSAIDQSMAEVFVSMYLDVTQVQVLQLSISKEM